ASGIRTVVPRLEVPVGDRLVPGALLGTETSGGVPVYFLQQDHYFDRDGLYGTGDDDYPDNCERFVFFCRGALDALVALEFLKWRLVFSDLLTTVSRTYAAEIRMPEFGNGLEGVLEERSGDLYGVVNGIDYEQWNPAKDPALVRPYSADEPEGKAVCREALRRELGLDEGPGPLVTMVTRLAWQKGLDLALESLPGMLEAGCRVALLGSGEAPLEEGWRQAAADHPGQVAVRIGYDTELSSRMYAGGDCTLMPSRYEPCGLSQLIALRYGAVPVVRSIGGLADTVPEPNPCRRTGSG